ncbi:MAG: ArnT family glycosyltransferase [Gemmatimonadales bacterium]
MSEPQVQPRWAWWAAATLLAGYVVMALVGRLPGIGVGNDDAMYFFLAKSLLQGTYRDVFLPNAPLHLQYPPGWPVLLAVPVAVLGDRPELLLMVPLALSTGGLLLLFDAARRLLPPVPSLAVLAVGVFNPLIITYGGRLKAEAALFFFAMLALWALASPAPSNRRMLLGAAAAIAAAFMRTAGIAVIAAVLLHFVFARRWRWAVGFALAAGVLFGPWLAWSVFGPRQLIGRSYAGDLLEVPGEQVLSDHNPLVVHAINALLRLRRYVLGHLHAVMGFAQIQGTLADNLAWLGLLLTAGLAGAVTLWKRFRVALLAIVCMFGLLSAWTWADRRFLHPVIPLVGLLLFTGAHVIGRRLGRHGSALTSFLVLLLLAPGTSWRTRDVLSRGIQCRQGELKRCYTPIEQSFIRAAEAARQLPDSAVIMTNREAAFAYHSHHLAVYSVEAQGKTGEELRDFLASRRVSHIVLTRVAGGGPVALASQLVELCERLDTLGDFGEMTVMFGLRSQPGDSGRAARVCNLTERLLAQAEAIHEEASRNVDLFQLEGTDER